MIGSKKHSYNISLIAILFLTILSFNFFQSFISSRIKSSESYRTSLSPDLLQTVNLGLQRLMSSYLWTISLLQSDIKHVKEGEISWLYHRFNSIAVLNPYFKENYQYGSLYLSVIHDDIESSQNLLTYGLIFFPEDEHLLWLAGFNLCFELNNCEASLEYFYRLLKLPRNKYHTSLPSIIAKIENTNNNSEVAFDVLLGSYNSLDEGLLKEKTHETLYGLKAKIDLSCLNSNQINCDLNDFEGNRYLFKNGQYFALKEWNEKRLKLRQKKSRE